MIRCTLALLALSTLALAQEEADSTPALDEVSASIARLLSSAGRSYLDGGFPNPELRPEVVRLMYEREQLRVSPVDAVRFLTAVADWDGALELATGSQAGGSKDSGDLWIRVLRMPVDAARIAALEVPPAPTFAQPAHARLWEQALRARDDAKAIVALRGKVRRRHDWETVIIPPESISLRVFVDCSSRSLPQAIQEVSKLAAGSSSRVQLHWCALRVGRVLRRESQGGTGAPSDARSWKVTVVDDAAQEEKLVSELFAAVGAVGSVSIATAREAKEHWNLDRLPTLVLENGQREVDRAIGLGRDTMIRLRSLFMHNMSPKVLEWAPEVAQFVRAGSAK